MQYDQTDIGKGLIDKNRTYEATLKKRKKMPENLPLPKKLKLNKRISSAREKTS